MKNYSKIVLYEWKLMRHEWFAMIMVFMFGLYSGIFQIESLESEFSNFVSIQEKAQSQFGNANFFELFINVFANALLTCLLVAFSGILFGVLSILFVTIQGIYSGFKIYALSKEMFGNVYWHEYLIVFGFEIVSIFALLCAGSLGLHAGKLMAKGIWQVLRKRETMIQAEFRLWWVMLKHNFVLILFFALFLAIGKAGVSLLLI